MAAAMFAASFHVFAAAPGNAIYAALAKDPIPPSLANKAQVHALAVGRDERRQGVVGSIIVSVPSERAYIRYVVFDTYANAQRGYRRYVADGWGPPMRRVAREEVKPDRNVAAGKVTCELQRNEKTRSYAGACLHLNATLPIVTRGLQPVKFNDKLKLGDASVQRAREILAASEALTLTGEGSLQAAKAADR